MCVYISVKECKHHFYPLILYKICGLCCCSHYFTTSCKWWVMFTKAVLILTPNLHFRLGKMRLQVRLNLHTQCYKSVVLIWKLVLIFYYWKRLNFAKLLSPVFVLKIHPRSKRPMKAKKGQWRPKKATKGQNFKK